MWRSVTARATIPRLHVPLNNVALTKSFHCGFIILSKTQIPLAESMHYLRHPPPPNLRKYIFIEITERCQGNHTKKSIEIKYDWKLHPQRNEGKLLNQPQLHHPPHHHHAPHPQRCCVRRVTSPGFQFTFTPSVLRRDMYARLQQTPARARTHT